MKIDLKIIALCLSLLNFSACEEFLVVPPQGQKTAQDLISELDENAPTQVVNAVYNQLYQWEQHSFSWIGVSSITSDDADKGSQDGDNGTDKHLLDNFTYGASDLSSSEVYGANFAGVARANRAIDAIPSFALEKNKENQLLGEAMFLRAYFYWNLVRCFGDVAKIDRLLDIEGNEEDFIQANTRVAKDEIYALIIKDLEFAIENLASKSKQSSTDLGRATSGAAKTFLAKVNLYQQNWSEVKRLTDEIIASGEYAISGVSYEEIWRESGENSVESIWEVQARGSDGGTLGIHLYTQVQGYRDVFGWGFNTPSQDLVDFYESGDLRKEATVIFDGETLWDGVAIKRTSTDIPLYGNEKSYVSKTKESFNGNQDQTNKNLRIFRYAEVLLMNAEAALNTGGDAATPLNAVRARAGLSAVSVVDINTVWRERRAELAMEHDRFFDLVRQGRAASILAPLGFTAGKNEVFPIPQSEINLSKGLLTQNPGY